jgi:quercetin dioxygenase-like cupin family protein
MTDPRTLDFSAAEPVSHDSGVTDREIEVDGTRWALVEYSPGAGREEWCDVPHSGFVTSGGLTYSFEDGSDPLVVEAGDAFALPPAPRHRGRNEGDEPARLFLIDALPGHGA